MPLPRWLLTSLVFPGIWLASIVAVCTVDIWWGLLVVWGCGIASYVVVIAVLYDRWRGRGSMRGAAFELAKRASLLALIIFGSIPVSDAYAALTRDPIGQVIDGSEDWLTYCRTIDLPETSNLRGMDAAVRQLHCESWEAGYDDFYFVFVHGADEIDARQNLVLRYEVEGISFPPAPPRVTWNTGSELRIDVASPVRQVTKQRTDIDGVVITYTVVAACPPAITAWQRAVFAVWHRPC